MSTDAYGPAPCVARLGFGTLRLSTISARAAGTTATSIANRASAKAGPKQGANFFLTVISFFVPILHDYGLQTNIYFLWAAPFTYQAPTLNNLFWQLDGH